MNSYKNNHINYIFGTSIVNTLRQGFQIARPGPLVEPPPPIWSTT